MYLTQLHRPSGQLYLPEAAGKLVQRYSFTKFPSLEELSNPVRTFGMGKFEDVQIEEFNVYSDGIIVSSMSDTTVLDAFIEDFFDWAESELGLAPTIIAKPEKHYESKLIVKSEIDLSAVIKPATAVLAAFNNVWKNNFDTDFELASFHLDCNPKKFSGRRKPNHFGLERRVNVPFEDNVFFSTAPFSTSDHLALLTKLESLG